MQSMPFRHGTGAFHSQAIAPSTASKAMSSDSSATLWVTRLATSTATSSRIAWKLIRKQTVSTKNARKLAAQLLRHSQTHFIPCPVPRWIACSTTSSRPSPQVKPLLTSSNVFFLPSSFKPTHHGIFRAVKSHSQTWPISCYKGVRSPPHSGLRS